MPKILSKRSRPASPADDSAALSEQAIVSAAVAIIAKHGVDGFNMRLLAAQLHVTPGAIYKHMGGKEAVLTKAANSIVESLEIDESRQRAWQDHIVAVARTYRKVCAKYRGIGAYLVLHHDALAANQRLLQYFTSKLLQCGLREEDALPTTAVLNAYIGGSIGMPSFKKSHGRGRPAERVTVSESEGLSDAEFEYGMRLLLRGIETARQ